MALSNQQMPTPQLLLNQGFCDISMLAEAIEWDLDFRQIEAGNLNARVALLAGPRNMAMRVEFNRWGFWHMGRFASDYRRQFGELPSQTLKSRQ